MNITYNDISKRAKSRGKKSNDSLLNPRLYTEKNVFCVENAINAITNWEYLAESSNDAFNKALDVFEDICINENASIINTCAAYLVENVDKVRDASQLSNSLKHRTSHLKSKNRAKITASYKPINNAITDSISNITKSLASKGVAVTTNTMNSKQATEEAFNALDEQCKKCKECDRIIENYAKISKRFNLDKIISEISYSNDTYIAIMEIAKCIDTYNIPFKNKYSHALEASYYALNKNNMNYPSEKIVEAVTDYFIFSSVLTEEDISSIKEVKDISVLFEPSDFNTISYLYDDYQDSIEDRIFGFVVLSISKKVYITVTLSVILLIFNFPDSSVNDSRIF